ncbi:sugar transport protein 13-like [Prosopis cineraria]|uniref:sugar transport protein 13-like n=1 Tax=Prosopis cineraria TaxID=364024 RepID=UPI00240EC9B4|nr:sugar transport protein 13-like [Prosopis cineraria]
MRNGRNRRVFHLRSNDGGNLEANITPIVLISGFMAATGGLLFGYDIGVSGGLTTMTPILKRFFPVGYKRTLREKGRYGNYCQYDNQWLQLYTSSLFLAGMAATVVAAYTTRKFGRRMSMLLAGIFSLCGTAFSAAAQDLPMLVIGRLLLGCGIGFSNQAVPVFLSEIAPTRVRGAMNILFHLNVTIGILFANLVNYGTIKIKGGWGWRVSLGVAGVPAVLITTAALLVADTPNSLIERGHVEEGKAMLRKLRGTEDVEDEFIYLLQAS